MKRYLPLALMFAGLAANAQTKKVIIEDFTGVKCGHCTHGTYMIEGFVAGNPNIIPIAIHTGDYTPSGSPLQTAEGDAVKNASVPAGYPAGAVDRTKYAPAASSSFAMGRTYWGAAIDAQKVTTAQASIGIANVKRTSAKDYELDVNVTFTEAPAGAVSLQVYVIEDKIAAQSFGLGGAMDLRQVNYHPLYGSVSQPDYLTSTGNGYYHNNVLRKALGDAWGFDFTPVVGQTYTKHVSFSVVEGASPTGWVAENLKLVAFVANNSMMSTGKQIINAEEYSLKGTFTTGVAAVGGVQIAAIHPNPAKATDVVKIQYQLEKSEVVTMRVLNMLGQEVAKPYSSFEGQGGHTIDWRPADNHVTAAGLYLVEVSSASGRQVQRINIQ